MYATYMKELFLVLYLNSGTRLLWRIIYIKIIPSVSYVTGTVWCLPNEITHYIWNSSHTRFENITFLLYLARAEVNSYRDLIWSAICCKKHYVL